MHCSQCMKPAQSTGKLVHSKPHLGITVLGGHVKLNKNRLHHNFISRFCHLKNQGSFQMNFQAMFPPFISTTTLLNLSENFIFIPVIFPCLAFGPAFQPGEVISILNSVFHKILRSISHANVKSMWLH